MQPNPRRLEQVLGIFEREVRGRPALLARAPGRVDLMGSHTDYNLGFVLTLPIGCDTWVAARERKDSRVRLYSDALKAVAEFDLQDRAPVPNASWENYVRGVAWVLQTEGLALRGFDGVIHSTVPISSGLSSSAALECAIATTFEALGGWRLDPVKKALLCQRAENQFVKVNCGILDQYTSCAGRAGCALLLDCRDLSSRPVKLAPGLRVVICDTKSKRELAGSEYGERRADCERGARELGVSALRELSPEAFCAAEAKLDARVARRCRFIVEENCRVLQLAQALEKGDRAGIDALTADSFRGACDLYEIASPAMRSMMSAMRQAAGAIGARQAGAGFGGCMVAFVDEGQLAAFTNDVSDRYRHATGIVPEVYAVDAAPGAGLINLPRL